MAGNGEATAPPGLSADVWEAPAANRAPASGPAHTQPPVAWLSSPPPAAMPGVASTGPVRSRSRRGLTAGVVTLLAAIVVAVILVVDNSGSSPSHTHTSAQSQFNPGGLNRPQGTVTSAQSITTQPTSTPVAAEPTVDWLGMQIQDSSTAAPVIDTVGSAGSAAAAGLEPGDVLLSVDGKPIASVQQLKDVVGTLRIGDTAAIEVSRGTTIVSTKAIVTGRPVSVR